MKALIEGSDLFELIKYTDHRHQILNLFKQIYKDESLDLILKRFELIVVGGQALALWQHAFFEETMSAQDYYYSFSDDADFYGAKPSLEFLESQLNIKPLVPVDFNPTVNVGMFIVPNPNFKEGMIVDIIHSLGGAERSEVLGNVEILRLEEIDLSVPVINPYICLKSRIHNYFATGYKPDKIKEINRVEFSVHVCNAYHTSLLESGRSREASRLCENIFKMAKTVEGSRLYINNSVDLLKSLNLNHELLNPKFKTERLPRALKEIESYRERRKEHYKRFNPDSTSIIDIAKPYRHGASLNLLDMKALTDNLSSADIDKKLKSEMLRGFFVKGKDSNDLEP